MELWLVLNSYNVYIVSVITCMLLLCYRDCLNFVLKEAM